METLAFVLIMPAVAGILFAIGKNVPDSTAKSETLKNTFSPPQATMLSVHKAMLCKLGIDPSTK